VNSAKTPSKKIRQQEGSICKFRINLLQVTLYNKLTCGSWHVWKDGL